MPSLMMDGLNEIQAAVMALVALSPAMAVMLMAVLTMGFAWGHTTMVILFGRKVELEEELDFQLADYEESSYVMEGFVREPSTTYHVGRVLINATNLAVLSTMLPVAWGLGLPGRAAMAWISEVDRWIIWPTETRVELTLTRTILVL